jgi:hypothetical protein
LGLDDGETVEWGPILDVVCTVLLLLGLEEDAEDADWMFIEGRE